MEPVEQRWEESEGKYMHKKFKKMASSMAAAETETDPTESKPLNMVTTIQRSPQKTSPVQLSLPPQQHQQQTQQQQLTQQQHQLAQQQNQLTQQQHQQQQPRIANSHQVYNHFPLKHSALSLVQTTAGKHLNIK